MNEHIEKMVEGANKRYAGRFHNNSIYPHFRGTSLDDDIQVFFRQELRTALTTYGDMRFNEGLERAKEVVEKLSDITSGKAYEEDELDGAYCRGIDDALTAIEKEKNEWKDITPWA